MRKVCLTIIFILSSLVVLFASDGPEENTERAWCEAANIGLVNLENIYYLPKFSREWKSSESNKYNVNDQDPDEGTYITGINIIGKTGCAYCDHNIRFTISTNGGRFVSVSDPTKYREFYVAIFPRCRYTPNPSNLDDAYYWEIEEGVPQEQGSGVNHEDRLPNTKATGSVSIIAPAFSVGDNYIDFDTGVKKNILRWWCDMLLCLEPLTTEDLMHLPKDNTNKEEFLATITVTWDCLDPDCDGTGANACHNGTYTFAILGYYGKKPDASQVSMFVTPDSGANSLNIINILNGTGEQRLAGLQLYSVSSGTSWNGKVSCFLSSNAAYNSSGLEFALVRQDGSPQTIPYTVKVVNSEDGAVQVYTGTASYPDCKDGDDNTGYNKRIDITNAVKSAPDRQGNRTYMLEYSGDVYIQLTDPGSAIRNNQALYSGVYKSTIWYHLVVD